MEPPRNKKKRSRKAQLAELAEARRAKSNEREDEDYEDAKPEDEPEDELEVDDDSVEQPGGAARREACAVWKRRQRNREKGFHAQATAMASWLASARPLATAAAGVPAVAAAQAERAAERAAGVAAERQIAAERAAEAQVENKRARSFKAARDAERYAQRAVDAAVGSPRATLVPRLARSFESEGACSLAMKRRANPTKPRSKQQRVPGLTSGMIDSILRIAKKRKLLRSDVVNGESMGRVEWAAARGDYLELRRVYALAIFVRARRGGEGSRRSFEQAAQRPPKIMVASVRARERLKVKGGGGSKHDKKKSHRKSNGNFVLVPMVVF